MSRGDRFLALTGGVGGAKLAVGLCALLGPEELSFVVNTGDDFEHLGLHVSPDLDSLMYALADLSNPDTGWGRRGETWHFIDTLRELGGESWFRLGDRDLAVHVQRSVRLREGASLSCVTRELNAALGTRHAIWPMSDDRVSTIVHTADGPPKMEPPIRISVTQGELASMLGVSRESVNKQLNQFMREGWLTLSRGAVTLQKPDALRTFA